MASSHDNRDRHPRGAVDDGHLFASAAMLLVAARGRAGRPRPRRLACLPFLQLGRAGSQTESGASAGAGGSLLWPLLPLAALLPWAPWSDGARPADAPAFAVVGRGEMSSHARKDTDDIPSALASLSLRASASRRDPGLAGPAWGAAAEGRAVLPASPSAASPVAAAPMPAPPRDPVPVTTVTWSVPLPRLRSPSPSEPPPAMPVATSTHHRWRPPSLAAAAHPVVTAAPSIPTPIQAGPSLPWPAPASPAPAAPPTLTAPPAAPSDAPALPWPGRPRATGGSLGADELPTLRAPAAPAGLPQVVQTLRKVVAKTVTEEVARAAAKLKAASAPAPVAALDLRDERTVRQLAAAVRRLEQDDRLRGGHIR